MPDFIAFFQKNFDKIRRKLDFFKIFPAKDCVILKNTHYHYLTCIYPILFYFYTGFLQLITLLHSSHQPNYRLQSTVHWYIDTFTWYFFVQSFGEWTCDEVGEDILSFARQKQGRLQQSRRSWESHWIRRMIKWAMQYWVFLHSCHQQSLPKLAPIILLYHFHILCGTLFKIFFLIDFRHNNTNLRCFSSITQSILKKARFWKNPW